MPRNPQTEQEWEETRARIFAAACELFDEGGIAGLSMRAVAARAGMSAAAIYRYFPAKGDLVAALWTEGIGELESRLRRIVENEPDPVAALRALAEAYADFAASDPVRFRLLFLRGDEAGIDSSYEFDFTSYDIARDCAARAIAQGRFKVTDADLATQTLWAAIHGVISLRLTCLEFPFRDPKDLIATAITTVMKGLLTDEER